MIIGVGKEIKTDEYRVALQPFQVKELIESGHQILVEKNAGYAAGFPDAIYESNGAQVVNKNILYKQSELILKIKCPFPDELECLREGQILFTYLHFDENIAPDKLMDIVNTGVTGLAYEWVREGSSLPLLEPMSALTGILFAVRSMEFLAKNKGKIAGSYLPSIEPAKCLIIGLGHIGTNSLQVMLLNNVEIDIVDKNPKTIEQRLQKYMNLNLWNAHKNRVSIIKFDQENPDSTIQEISKRISKYDIILNCAVRRPNLPKDKCEYLITRSMVQQMEKNSILCDTTACDRDLVETAISNERLDYVYFDEGVLHYNCDHLPSYVPSTATKMLTEATFPYIKMLANGFIDAVKKSQALFDSTMCYQGKLIHEYSAEKKGLSFTNLGKLL